MNAYMYQAALYCEDCGEEIKGGLTPDDDSDSYPQGPYPDGGGEADYPQHCDSCGLFLENPLTSVGWTYVQEAINRGEGAADVLDEWSNFYDIKPEDEGLTFYQQLQMGLDQ